MAFHEMTASRLATYLAGVPEVVERLGERTARWQVRELGADARNQAFVLEGPEGSVFAKQVLPDALDQSEWPLPPDRATFEEAALTLYGRLVPGRVPRVLHFDSEQYLIVMECLRPHVLLRDALMRGETFPELGDHLAAFLARTLFFTSDLGVPATEKKERMAFFCANVEPVKVNRTLAFSEPYAGTTEGSWTSPELDDLVRDIRADDPLKRAVAALELKYLSEPQALLHGRLDSGAIMVTQADTRIIDPEFAFFGPIGFDVGELLGSLFLAYFGQAADDAAPRTACETWLLQTIETVWRGFRDGFVRLWRDEPAGDAYPRTLFEGPGGPESLAEARDDYMSRLFEDALRFAGATIIRRTLGREHAPEFAGITDRGRRIACERRALLIARELVKDAHHVTDIEEVTAVARQLREQPAAV